MSRKRFPRRGLKGRSLLRRSEFWFAAFPLALLFDGRGADKQLALQSAGGDSSFRAATQRRTAVTAGIADYARPEDETYLSYPEWYIVWSYQEKADFQEKNLPSGFPFFGAVRQYWGSYAASRI